MKKLLSSIDLYSIKPSDRITFKEKEIYSSTIGKSFSLIVILVSIAAFFYFGSDMILKANPRIVISELYTNNPQDFKPTKENLFFSFSVQNYSRFNILDESLFYPELTIIQMNSSRIVKVTPVPLKICDQEDTPSNNELSEYFLINPVLGMYCVEDYSKMKFFGTGENSEFAFARVSFYQCQNGSKIICKSQEEITDFFNENLFSLIFIPVNVDSQNYHHPLNQQGRYVSIPSQANIKTSITVNLQYIDVQTDDNFFFKNNNMQRGLQKKEINNLFLPRTVNGSYLDLDITIDNVIKKYNRTYLKFPEVLANTGGIIKILIIFFAIFVKPITLSNFYKELSSEYFEFDGVSKAKPEGQRSICNSISNCMCRCHLKDSKQITPKKNVNDKIKAILNQRFNLSEFLKKFNELEKLKFLLLDAHQLILFDSANKPKISSSKINNNSENKINSGKDNVFFQKKEMSRISIMDKNASKDLLVKDAFQYISSKLNKSSIDEKLLVLNQFVAEIIGKEKEASVQNIIEKERLEYPRILSQSLEEINLTELKKPPILIVNTDIILKDLETLNMGINNIN